MAITNPKPWLTLLVGALIAYGSVMLGSEFEALLISRMGAELPGWLSGIAGQGYFIIFPLMVLAAWIAGRVAGGSALALGNASLKAGIYGLLLGALLASLGVGASLLTGNARIEPPPRPLIPMALLTSLLIFFVQTAAEEVLFRGFVQRVVQRYWGGVVAVILAAALFAMSHWWPNPSLHWFVVMNLFLGGLVFGLLYRYFGGLAAPIACHFAYNWCDMVLFGVTPNPGYSPFGAILDVEIAGQAQLGGVEEGLMASVFTTVLLVIVIGPLLLALKRKRVVPDAKSAALATPAIAKTPVPAQMPATPVAQAAADVSQDEIPTLPPVARDDQTMMIGAAELAALKSAAPAVAPPPPPPVQTTPMESPVPAGDSPDTGAGGAVVQTGTHQGCVRELNEDRFMLDAAAGVYAVADGMGGHKFGDRAATLIVEHLERADKALPLDGRVASVSAAILDANRVIYEEAQSNGSRMGSTAVTLVIEGQDYVIGWVGDSRAYRFRDGQVQRLTKDHTQVQEMVDRGLLQPDEVARHPMSHVLVRAVGVSPDVELDQVRGTIETGDVFFLCSDGIYDVLEEDEIADLLAKAKTPGTMDKMIAMSLDLGARDNVTGIIVVPAAAM